VTSLLQNSSVQSATDLPCDCTLALAFPLSRDEFFHSAESEPEDGFIRSWIRRYPGYPLEDLWIDFAPIAHYASDLARVAAEELGVHVLRDPNVASWADALSTRRVTTLFAHWSVRDDQDFIQFAGGFVSSCDCAESVPNPFYGVLDMTVCCSTRLIKAVKSRRPKCTVIANRNSASLNIRLAIYRQALRLLATRQYSFVDAMLKIHSSGLEVL